MRDEDSDLTGYYAYGLARAKRYYKLLVILIAIAAVLVLAYVHAADPVYRAGAALTPPKDPLLNAAGLAGMSTTSNLASIGRRLGLGMGGGGAADDSGLFDEYTRVLQSNRLAERLAGSPAFLALAFPRQFDGRTGHLRKREGWLAATATAVKVFLGLLPVTDSDTDRVFKFLTDNLSISSPHDPTTNISEITLRFDDGATATKLLETILVQADTLMRADKRQDIAARIAYLQDQLGKITLEEQRTALISLLTLQQSTMMIIAADHRYASYVVESPYAPQKPAWPTLGSVIGLILFIGVLGWIMAIYALPEKWLARFASDRQLFSTANSNRILKKRPS